jgi:hypothetical protein
MKKTIYCKTVAKGMQAFYVEVDGKSYYLFNQKYRVGVRNYFVAGKSVNDLAAASKHHNSAVRRTATKLPAYLKFVEKEYDVVIYDKMESRKSKAIKRAKLSKAERVSTLLDEYYCDCAC